MLHVSLCGGFIMQRINCSMQAAPSHRAPPAGQAAALASKGYKSEIPVT